MSDHLYKAPGPLPQIDAKTAVDLMTNSPPSNMGQIERPPGGHVGDILNIGLWGPVAIMGALNKTPPPWMRLAMLVIGVGSVVYSVKRFVDAKKLERNPQ